MSRTHETAGGVPGVRTDPLAARRMLANVRARLFGTASAPIRVGPYEVVRRLGAGSMGTVFEAYDPRLLRSVALKLVALPDDDVVREQMLGEAQALARIHHAHVVEVFDAGVDECVWVAMQLLEGRDLERWSTEPHDVAESLARLRDVGEGVAAVHEAGLVHRDVKPSNAFVTSDGRGCLVDFGLAIDAGDTVPTAASSAGWPTTSDGASRPRLGGTPAYMAPEQHRGERAVPASDQFAWCAMAWELLYGTRPFAAATVDGLLARKLEGKLPRSPLRADVPRDLHVALLRGLAAEPEARHASMRCLLDALPTGAPSRTRRRALVLCAAAGVVAVATTSRAAVGIDEGCADASAPWGARERAEVRAALVGDVALDVAAAERVDARITAVAQAHDAARTSTCESMAAGAITTATADRRLACLSRWRTELVALVDTLRGDVDGAPVHAWTWAAELDDPSTCLALDEPMLSRHPPAPAELASSVETARRELVRAAADLRRGDLEAARRRALDVRDAAEAIRFRPLVAEAALELGGIYRRGGQTAEAEASLSSAYFEAYAAQHAYVEVHAAMAMIQLVVHHLGRPQDGWSWLQRARMVDARGFTAIDVGLLAYEGMIHTALEDYEAALGPLERAVARARELGEDHPAYLGVVSNLVLGLNNVERYDEALALAREHVADQTRALGSDHPSLASTWYQLAIAAWELDDLSTAHDAFARSIALDRRHYGDRSQAVAVDLSEVGRRAVVEADAPRAIAALDEAVAIVRETVGEDHPSMPSLALSRGEAALLAGRPDEATRWFERARVLGEAAFGADHVLVTLARAGSGRAALAAGDVATARALLEPAWAGLQPTEDPAAPMLDCGEVRFALAQARWLTGDEQAGRALAEEALAMLRRRPHFAMDRLARAIEEWVEGRR